MRSPLRSPAQVEGPQGVLPQPEYALAQRHMLSAAVAAALESAGYKDERSALAIGISVRRALFFDRERKAVCAALEEAGIWYVLMKGLVLRQYYPKFGMREMTDNDILFDADRAEDVRDIMERLGFTTVLFGDRNQDVYQKPPMLNFEMHSSLFGVMHDQRLYRYYQSVKERLVPCGGMEYRFTPEDFYVYMIAHEHMHYYSAGTGLKGLVDVYVYLKHVETDAQIVREELDKLGILQFEQALRSLSLHLFGNEALTDADREMLDYMLSSGAHGTRENVMHNEIRRAEGSKLKYARDRFFGAISKNDPQHERHVKRYPLFFKYKILLPFLPFYRIWNAVRSGRFRKELKLLLKTK